MARLDNWNRTVVHGGRFKGPAGWRERYLRRGKETKHDHVETGLLLLLYLGVIVETRRKGLESWYDLHPT